MVWGAPMDERFEVLDAFVDGELVDPGDVKRALSEPEGRDYLLDAWLLRGVVQEEMATDIATPVPVRAAAPRRQPAFAKATAGRSWAVAALPALDRDVFLLREIVGLSYGEIASACDVTVESVRSRLHQARQTLRRALGATLDVRSQRGVRSAIAGRVDRGIG